MARFAIVVLDELALLDKAAVSTVVTETTCADCVDVDVTTGLGRDNRGRRGCKGDLLLSTENAVKLMRKVTRCIVSMHTLIFQRCHPTRNDTQLRHHVGQLRDEISNRNVVTMALPGTLANLLKRIWRRAFEIIKMIDF